MLTELRLLLCLLLCLSLSNSTLFAQLETVPVDADKSLVNKDTQATLSRIAFGSCSHQARKNGKRIWVNVAKSRPELWIWMGDNIYGDTENMELMKKKYDRQKSNVYYAEFLKICPVIGIWDDHDYGVNDGDKTYPMKAASKKLMLDFLDVPKHAAVRTRPGAYQAYSYGSGEQKVKIILLDTRYFRDALKPDLTGPARYLPNPNGDMLGEEQWQWLRRQLTQSDARVHLIVSSVQVLPQEQNYEKWANFPSARQRLLNLLAETQVRNPILLSGDRHMAEISALKIPSLVNPLHEITSSGMTHTWSDTTATEPNRLRVGPLVVRKNFATLTFQWEYEKPHAVVSIRHAVTNEELYNYVIPLQ